MTTVGTQVKSEHEGLNASFNTCNYLPIDKQTIEQYKCFGYVNFAIKNWVTGWTRSRNIAMHQESFRNEYMKREERIVLCPCRPGEGQAIILCSPVLLTGEQNSSYICSAVERCTAGSIRKDCNLRVRLQ